MGFGGLEVHRLIYLPEAILEASPGVHSFLFRGGARFALDQNAATEFE
jgi:hypothetical protein